MNSAIKMMLQKTHRSFSTKLLSMGYKSSCDKMDLKAIENQCSVNAKQAESQIEEIEKAISKLVASKSETLKKQLKAENAKLRQEVENLKNGMSNGTVPTSLSSSISQPKTAVETDKAEPKLDKPKKEKKEKPAKPAKKVASDVPVVVDVSRLDFRIGKIMSVEKHPGADSLYIEQIDCGEEKPRTVVSGLVKFYQASDLSDQMVVLLCNLKPASMRGTVSQAMVMCASTPEKVEFLRPPTGAVPGDLVEFEGYTRTPDAVLNPKKKVFETIAPDLKTDSSGVATYKGIPFTVPNKGPVKAPTLFNVQIK